MLEHLLGWGVIMHKHAMTNTFHRGMPGPLSTPQPCALQGKHYALMISWKWHLGKEHQDCTKILGTCGLDTPIQRPCNSIHAKSRGHTVKFRCDPHKHQETWSSRAMRALNFVVFVIFFGGGDGSWAEGHRSLWSKTLVSAYLSELCAGGDSILFWKHIGTGQEVMSMWWIS